MTSFIARSKKLQLLSIPLIFSAVLIVTACTTISEADAPDQGEIEPVSATNDEPVNLRFTLWSGNEGHLAILNNIAADYQKAHPNVTVRFDTIPFAEYVSKVTIQLNSSDPPDAGWIVEASAPTFIEAGTLANLGPTLKQNPDYDYADLTESAMELWVRNNAVYGVPFSTSPFLIIYNRDLFETAGVETPDQQLANGKWTWEALAEAARIIAEHAPPGTYGFESKDGSIYTTRVWHTLVPMMRAYGGDSWNAEGQCLLATPSSVAAVQLYHDMVFVDHSAVPPGEQADFFSGQAAMAIAQLSRVDKLAEATFDWGIVPLPSGPAGEQPIIGQAAVVVFEASPHKEVAMDFVAFMTNRENVTRLAKFFPPARISVLESEAVLEANPMIDAESMERTVISAIKTGTVLPAHADYPKIDLIARAQFDRLWQPEADVQGILSDVCREISPLLNP